MQLIKTDIGYIAFHNDLLETPSQAWFNVEFWRKKQAITGSSQGRYTTWFMKYIDKEWVLRHYYRGGLIEKISHDKYLFCGLNKTRPITEFQLLDTLYNEGFAVPKPIAANITKHGPFYRGDLIIERIKEAQDLLARLESSPMTDQEWYTLGSCIALFHKRGVFHADLNAKNILLAKSQFYLIDFDRGAIKKANTSWKQANLKRLLRSFNKEKGKSPTLAFTFDNWQQLLKGYQSVKQ
ncbi:3-deoxy-D-manno-octulosonic acid kinase [uncultured Shewanella sp.]|uniref:3-deoxy-D-manno-octulosonic acid kinase n=1 Tax=uncultured Shewanella sp. TaxID=173975 RepID=UPI00260AACD2|nr:3-deoxy-D-manno-octulosonic acid kinase [uncultured Shewanella sp.]